MLTTPINLKTPKPFAFIGVLIGACLLSACQSTPKPTAQTTPSLPATALTPSIIPNSHPAPLTPTPITTPAVPFLPNFAITGKIGITTQHNGKKQAISAFYAWGQTADRFAIDLTGTLGLGATSIRFDGKQATLNNDEFGTVNADSPELLLQKTTGWQAPISHLPYWILGKNAPGDTNSLFDGQKLTQTQNNHWTIQLEYNNLPKYNNLPTPSRLRLRHHDGHQVVMTINQANATQ